MIHYMTVQGVADVWVANEILAMKRAGIPIALTSLRRPESTYFTNPEIVALNRDTNALYPLSKGRAIRALLAAPGQFGGRFWRALGAALFGPRETLRIRALGLWHLAVACHWAAGLRGQPVTHIHSQWIHAGGSVAMYGAILLDTRFSFTGHAADLFRERSALKAKIEAAEFIVCISEFHRDFYLSEGADPDKLFVVYCGIDTTHFTPTPRTRPEGAPLRILSSGRLVEKKGFDVLIEALALLRDRGRDFEAEIAGSGPLEPTLRAQIDRLGLGDRVTLTGQPLLQEDLPGFMAGGDIYTLACVRAPDGDIDGLPQMLMEAMACERPVVSTDLVGIPDLVRDEETGLLVPPEDPVALAGALERLADDPALADRLAQAGRDHVRETFSLDDCVAPLLARYRAKL